ncbi:MAG: site-specific DNA-methyltransferase [Patescibacteria group bacterium]
MVSKEERLQQQDNQILRLQKEIEKLKKSIKVQKYGLVWADVPEAFEDDFENKLPVLEEVPRLAIKNKDGKPTHILIEGDNYHALTCLNYTHKGKIDVIYIDPPYNTGEDGFRYKDKRILDKFPDGTEVPKDHPFRHSYWLSFMRKRLELAQTLLSDTGVIIVHIDENEVFNLGLLMNEVFEEKNSLGVAIWNKMNPKGDALGISVMHEYLLCYAKDKSKFITQKDTLLKRKENAEKILNRAKSLYNKLGKKIIPEAIKEVIKPFGYSQTKLKEFEVEYTLELINKEFQNWLSRQNFSGGEKAYKYIDKNGMVYRGVSMAWPNKETAPNEYFQPLVHPITGKECPVPKRGWRNPPETMRSLLERGLVLFGADETNQPERKYLLKDNLLENTSSVFNYAGSDDDLLELLGISFPYSKPVNVGKFLLSAIHPNPRIILDFFAGSGTVAQAVLELNEEDKDKKSRQFILVTDNENKIMSDACYPRISKIINGYEGSTPTGGSLRYYKTGFVGKHNILDADDKDRVQLAYHAGEMLSIAENTLEAIEKTGYWQIFESRDRFTAVYFREEYDELDAFVEKVNKLKKPASVYIFSWEDDPFVADFEDSPGVTVKTIPQPILEIYKQIYNLI